MNWTANTLTKAITGKSPSTTYYYNIVVRDAAANKSLYDGKTQATTADTTVPTAGAFAASTSVGSSGFTLNWTAATDNVTAGASLEYFVCSGASTAAIDTAAECEAATQEMNWTANTLTKAITGKSPSTTYYYNVVVRDAAANKSLYNGKTQATSAPSAQRIFMSNAYNGNLGGLAGADAICQGEADAVSLGGTWKAILSSSTVSAYDRITVSGIVNTIGGTKIVDNKADMFDSSFDAAPSFDENGTSVDGGQYVWTGTDNAGQIYTGQHCSDWTSTAATGRNVNPMMSYISGPFGSSSTSCTSTYRLYCIDGQ